LFEVTYSHGECEAVSTFEVLNDEPIGLVDAGEDQVVAFGLDAQMQGTTTSDNYVWTSDNIGIIIDQIDDLNTNIEVPIAGAYDMILTASNGICVASDTTTVSFPGLVVPNTITPNGDHINDNFIIPGDQVATVWLRIVNRWGQVVYEHHNYMNDWSGQNNNGELLPPDTYFYEFKVAEITETGFIQIQ
jgi:gliding motility-associated-like protein